MENTTRHGLWLPEEGDAATTLREAINANANALDTAALDDQGTLAGRPVSTPSTPGKAGRYYYATDTGQLFRDHGTGWLKIFGAIEDFYHVEQANQLIANSTTQKVALAADGSKRATGWTFDDTDDSYVCVAPGWYEVEAVVAFAGNLTGYRELSVYKNGALAQFPDSYGTALPPAASNSAYVYVSFELQFAATDRLSLRARHNAGASLNIQGWKLRARMIR